MSLFPSTIQHPPLRSKNYLYDRGGKECAFKGSQKPKKQQHLQKHRASLHKQMSQRLRLVQDLLNKGGSVQVNRKKPEIFRPFREVGNNERSQNQSSKTSKSPSHVQKHNKRGSLPNGFTTGACTSHSNYLLHQIAGTLQGIAHDNWKAKSSSTPKRARTPR